MYEIHASCIFRTDATVTTIDTDNMHKWFECLSLEALFKACKHTCNFADTNLTKSVTLCSRCYMKHSKRFLVLDRQWSDNAHKETDVWHAIILRLDRGRQWVKQKCFLGTDSRRGSRDWDLTLCLYCVDPEWEIQVVKEYFIYYELMCTDQETMARKEIRKKLIEHCGNGEYWLVCENWWRRG